jgi:hypothetical protein
MFKNKHDIEGLEYQRFLCFFEERPNILHPAKSEPTYELPVILTAVLLFNSLFQQLQYKYFKCVFAVLHISLAIAFTSCKYNYITAQITQ